MRVWALTTIRRWKPTEGGLRDSRTVAVYSTPEKAAEAVGGNYGDLEEAGYYQFAVVEPVQTDVVYGLTPEFPTKTQWFEYVTRNRQWESLPGEPDVLRRERGRVNIVRWASIG